MVTKQKCIDNEIYKEKFNVNAVNCKIEEDQLKCYGCIKRIEETSLIGECMKKEGIKRDHAAGQGKCARRG